MENKKNTAALCSVLLKRRLKKPSFLLILCTGLLLQYLLGSLILPDVRNTQIGILNRGGIAADRITENLKKTKSRYSYRYYTSEEAMREDTATGRIDSGFILDERLDSAEAGALSDRVTYVCSTSSSKGELVKEELFSLILEVLSEKFLYDMTTGGSITKDSSESSAEAVVGTYRDLLSGGEVLDVFFEDSESGERIPVSEAGQGLPEDSEGASAGSGSRIAVLLIFGAALFFAADRFHGGEQSLLHTLRPAGRRRFILADEMTAVFLFTAALTAFSLFTGSAAPAGALRRTAAFLVCVPLTALWASGFARLFRKEALYLYAVLSVVVLAAVFSGGQLPAVNVLTRSFSWIKWLFPTTWYISMLGI